MKSSAKARRQRDDRAYAEFEAMMRRLAKASRRDIEGVTSPTRSHRADRPNRRIAGPARRNSRRALSRDTSSDATTAKRHGVP